MIGKLTPWCERRVGERIASPVIIRAKERRLRDVVSFVSEYELIGRYLKGRPLRLLEEIRPFESIFMRVWPRFRMCSALLPREIIYDLAEEPNIERIFFDDVVWALNQFSAVPEDGVFSMPVKRKEFLDFTSTFWTKKLLGVDDANERGYTGKNILAATIDTGCSRIHEQTHRVKFVTTIPAQRRDENGHGTWVTSCVGGITKTDDIASAKARKRVVCEGMAPECDLLAIKCLGYYIGVGSKSNIIEAIHIALEEGADIISMSLGGPSSEGKPTESPYYEVMEEANKNYSLPIVAVGNSGPESNTVASPGGMPNVLTVGAFNPITGRLANFSSRGPTNWGAIKPDVVAPGVHIDSASVGVCDRAGDQTESRYSPISGTSMATPGIAGLITCVKQLYRERLDKELTLPELKAIAESYAEEAKNNDFGWGELDWSKFEHWMNTEYGEKIGII